MYICIVDYTFAVWVRYAAALEFIILFVVYKGDWSGGLLCVMRLWID